MNERFWEIVEQADLEGGDDPDIRDQVFAKLIVQECSRVAKLQSLDNRVCDAIEGHFGINE